MNNLYSLISLFTKIEVIIDHFAVRIYMMFMLSVLRMVVNNSRYHTFFAGYCYESKCFSANWMCSDNICEVCSLILLRSAIHLAIFVGAFCRK